MKIVPPWSVWSLRELAMSSLSLGFGLFLSLICVLIFQVGFFDSFGALQKSIVVLLIITNLVVCPLIAMRHCREHLNSFGRRLFAIAWTSIGFFVLPYTATVAAVSGRMAVFTWQLLALHGIVFAIWTLLALVAWPIIRRRSPFVIQDGATCPECGYCVRGVASAICPECGTAFDHTQLGLSIPEFNRLIAGGENKDRRTEIDRSKSMI